MTRQNWITEPGTVVWITGLSGAGKTTIAQEVVRLLRRRQSNVVLLDGDQFRALMGEDLGHSPGDRLTNALRIGRFCRFLSNQGFDVVCATMSLFRECQEWNRHNIPKYREVYIRVPIAVLADRSPHELYRRARCGEACHVVGVDLPFHEPLHPDLVIDNSEPRTDFESLALRILDALAARPSAHAEALHAD